MQYILVDYCLKGLSALKLNLSRLRNDTNESLYLLYYETQSQIFRSSRKAFRLGYSNLSGCRQSQLWP